MNTRKFPLKYFEKRNNDEHPTEGGGDSSLRKWIDKSLLLNKVEHFKNVLKDIDIELNQRLKQKNNFPVVLTMQLEERAYAKSYRRAISSVFDKRKQNVIGVLGQDEVLVKIDNLEDLKEISEIFNRVHLSVDDSNFFLAVASISSIEPFKTRIIGSLDTSDYYKIKLINYHDISLNHILMKSFETYCNENRITYKKISYSEELNIYKVDKIQFDAFEGIERISPMPKCTITMDSLQQTTQIPIKEPTEGVVYPIVGVLDSGIGKNEHLRPWLCEEKESFFIDKDIDRNHGTFVAGIVEYGDELEESTYVGSNGCKLFDATVMPCPSSISLGEDELIDNIKSVIKKHSDIKIWNLSLGTDQEADLFEFSDFAKALDEIQQKYDILICKSTGNSSRFMSGEPVERLAKSADTIRGLVVGSLAQKQSPTDLAKMHEVSPFSRIGPGPSRIIKPDVVHYGGNAGLDSNNHLTTSPVSSFGLNDQIIGAVGTSFSTPRITALAAGLMSKLDGVFQPLLIKALIIHSANYPKEIKNTISDKLHQTGFGLPSNIDQILYNDQNEITLVLRDTIEKGHFINMYDFPYPGNMVDDKGYYYGEVIVTLVTDPILEGTQGSEYCQSNIEVKFGTYDEKYERPIDKPNVKNPIGLEGSHNVLAIDNYSKKSIHNYDSKFATERVLVTYEKKFQPVKKWHVNLEEFTPSNKNKILKSPKHWYLKIEGLFRQFTEEKYKLADEIPTQDFCLLITIKDNRKKNNVYADISNQLNEKNFINGDIHLRQETRIQSHVE